MNTYTSIVLVLVLGFGISNGYAETFSVPIHTIGFETRGGSLSIIEWQFDESMNFVSGYMTVPDKQWNPIKIDLINPEVTRDEDMNLVRIMYQPNPDFAIMHSVMEHTNNTMLVKTHMSLNEMIIPYEHILNVTNIQVIKTPNLFLDIKKPTTLFLDEEVSIFMKIKNDDTDQYVSNASVIVELLRNGVTVIRNDGSTNQFGTYGINWFFDSQTFVKGCYKMNVFIEYDGAVIKKSFDVLVNSKTKYADTNYQDLSNCN